MSITTEKKQKIIKDFATKDKDTGSPEVQVAIISERIKSLSGHMETHKKDVHSRRGLISLVNKRRSLLDYLKNVSEERYQTLIKKLGLRK